MFFRKAAAPSTARQARGPVCGVALVGDGADAGWEDALWTALNECAPAWRLDVSAPPHAAGAAFRRAVAPGDVAAALSAALDEAAASGEGALALVFPSLAAATLVGAAAGRAGRVCVAPPRIAPGDAAPLARLARSGLRVGLWSSVGVDLWARTEADLDALRRAGAGAVRLGALEVGAPAPLAQAADELRAAGLLGGVVALAPGAAAADGLSALAAFADALAAAGAAGPFTAPPGSAQAIDAASGLAAVSIGAAETDGAADLAVVCADDPGHEERAARLLAQGCAVILLCGDEARRLSAPAAPDALADRLRAALGIPAQAPSVVGARLAERLGVSVAVDRALFNPWTRLFVLDADVAGDVSPDDLGGDISAPGGGGLVNAWARSVAPRPGYAARLRASAVLAAGVEPEDLSVTLGLRGWPVARLSGDVAPSVERSGLIALQPDAAGGARIDFWGEPGDARLQVGRRQVVAEPVRADPGRPATFSTTQPFPFDRETLTTLPEAGVGQKFTAFAALTAPARPSSARLAAMRDRFAGREAWLIGNGPSVRLADLDRLQDAGALCFGFNRFHLAHDRTRLRPAFTVTADRQMIEDFGLEIVASSGGMVFVANDRCPDLAGDYCWVRQVGMFPSLFSRDASRFVTPGGSSLYVAMQIGYFLGVRKWRVYGADFAFRFEPSLRGGDVFRAATGDGNHFIAGYRSGRAWCPPSIENIMPSFLAARQLMEAEGGFIRNATRGGALEVFEREEFDHALAAV
ncbi:hypothetical protein [Rubrimonas cliftonensis]|uniref:Uncharacterized protein n=1 Tax=Rubrimonas cliftonensis TaxID=89524 RepID=A0A1H4CX00_9RHOB|nr:hypothetical protein [Rubrimonas cliftonensis]SEA64993.1 hypothetical protein SAMN05444370_10889 [Rubrimonas cliftonensis]